MPDPCAPIRRQPLNSLSTKIIFFVFLSTFLTALAVSWISIESTYQFLRRRIDESFPAVLDRASHQLGSWLVERESEAQNLAVAMEGRLQTPSHEAATAALRGMTSDGSLRLTKNRAALVLGRDAQGSVLAEAGDESVHAADVPPDLRAELAQIDAPVMRSFWRRDGHPLLVVAAPVRDAGSEILGTLVLVSPTAGLAASLSSETPSQGARIHVVDPAGRLLASSEPLIPGALLALPEPDGDGVAEYVANSGERLIGTARAVPATSWRIVVEEPFERAFEPVLSVVTRIFVTDLGIIFLFSFLAYQITAAIVKPIEALSEGARRVSQGELDLEIPDTRGNDEIGLLTRTFNDMMRKLRKNQLEIEAANRQLLDQNDALQRANEVLAQLSITDGLTKLHNHRFFQDHLTREIKRVQRTGEPLAILLVDIDDFKRLNDRLGHAAGDELLVRIARIMNDAMRESDLLARYGGEEFVVLASGTDLRGAATLAEKVRGAVAESTFLLDDSNRLERVTVSIGVAQFKGDRKGFFQGADRALYRAKGAGKNCVRVDENV